MTLDQMWAEFQNRYPKQKSAEPVVYTIDEMINYWTIRYSHTNDPKDLRILNQYKAEKI